MLAAQLGQLSNTPPPHSDAEIGVAGPVQAPWERDRIRPTWFSDSYPRERAENDSMHSDHLTNNWVQKGYKGWNTEE